MPINEDRFKELIRESGMDVIIGFNDKDELQDYVEGWIPQLERFVEIYLKEVLTEEELMIVKLRRKV